jgi:flagellar biosynthesis chaperone FliJ
MVNLHKLYKKPKVFQRLTGLTPDKFEQLLIRLEPLFKESELKRKKTTNRKRKLGGGRKQKLSLGQALFMLLLYYRTYTSHMFLSMVMGIDDSSVCHYFKRIQPLLAQIFRIPERKIKMSEDEILELIIDATEQESQKRDGSGYSGKKKKNTVKTQIMVTHEGKIKSVSRSVPGNMHDKKLYDKTGAYTTIKVKRKGDLAYIGTSCQTPIKKKKNKELTPEQKSFNKQFSRTRIGVEHVFAHLKKFNILNHKFRNSINNYNLIFKNIAGIRNLQLELA